MQAEKTIRARRSAKTLATLAFAGLVLVTGSILAACESSSSSSGGIGTFEAGPGFDATSGERPDGAAPDATADAPDAAPAPPFEGVWEGMQSGATVELSNAGGCTLIKNMVGGVLCDECVGTYVVTNATTATTVVKCQAVAACSVSPPHTNTGTFTRGDGGALTYAYDYGFGSATLELPSTTRAPGDVCGITDAGAGD